ncbi:hypothetical protein [Bradyrhizobium sp.]|uniref:hypothetical protein n=1 Tax=Bradyrhizobium sp. TaxID=376 RepID=UPI003C72C34A
MVYRIVAERENETVKIDRTSALLAVAKARVWASEGWNVTIIVAEENQIAAPAEARVPAEERKLLTA